MESWRKRNLLYNVELCLDIHVEEWGYASNTWESKIHIQN